MHSDIKSVEKKSAQAIYNRRYQLASVACYLFCHFTIFRGHVKITVLEPGEILCNSTGLAFTAAQIYLKFRIEPDIKRG